jgi:hypothetical protein
MNIELIFILIGLLLIVYFTIEFVKAIKRKEKTFLKSLWEWIKKLFDLIGGMG